MSFVQRGMDMVNERLNRVKGSPEQKPAEFPAEVPLTIDEGRGPAPSLPASTSSSLPAAGDARGVLGVPGGAPTRIANARRNAYDQHALVTSASMSFARRCSAHIKTKRSRW